jgi:hypothetical protein
MAARRDAEADERERIADERERIADQRELVADQRETEADERDCIADERESEADERERADIRPGSTNRTDEHQRFPAERDRFGEIRSSAGRSARTLSGPDSLTRHKEELGYQILRLRVHAADLADRMAYEAEAFAAHLENSAERGDAQRRLAIARTEHEVARIEHQNAARLRDLSTRYEPAGRLPRFPGT